MIFHEKPNSFEPGLFFQFRKCNEDSHAPSLTSRDRASKNPERDQVTRREGELRVIVRRQGEVAAETAKNTDVRLAWKIEVSTVILPAKN